MHALHACLRGSKASARWAWSTHTSQAGHTDYVVPVAWVPPGRLPDLPNGAVLSGEETVAAASRAGQAGPRPARRHAHLAASQQPSPLRRLVAGSKDTTGIVWDPTSAAIVQRLAGGHKYAVTGVGLLLGGEVVTCSLDQ